MIARAARRAGSAACTILAAWRGITRTGVVATFALGIALLVSENIVDVARGNIAPGRLWLVSITRDEIRAFAFLLAFVVADRVAGRDPARRGTYAAGVAVGAVVAGFGAWIIVGTLFGRILRWGPVPGLPVVAYQTLQLLMLGGAAVWVVLDRRRASLARATLHRAELERVAAEKRSIESDLQAMQARVEPQFLFNTLAQVKILYAEDAARGEPVLDQLIAYLRAAMPKMRDTSSTLGQEVDLARAYLAIVGVRDGGRFDYSIESAGPWREVRFPPMLLLPLIDHAAACGDVKSGARRSMRIALQATGERAQLEFTDTADGFASEGTGDAIARLRWRLATLFGDDATLELGRTREGGSRAVLALRIELHAMPQLATPSL